MTKISTQIFGGSRSAPAETEIAVIARPDIEHRLDQLIVAVDRGLRPIVLMSAPTGFGKTSVLGRWTRRAVAAGRCRSAWIGHGAPGMDQSALWSAIARGLSSEDVDGPAAGGGRGGAPAAGGDPEAAVARICSDSAVPVVLIVENGHLLDDQTAVRSWDEVLAQLPPNVGVVIAGRHDPPLIWTNEKWVGRISRIGQPDLAMTADEVAEMLAQHHVVLTAGQVRDLTSLTGGWAALVAIAAVFLAQHNDPARALLELAASPQPISDVVVGHMLATLTDPVLRFMTRTSVVPWFTADLAEALTESDAASHLLDMQRCGVPLSVRAQGQQSELRYNYPPLLRAHLLGELRRSDRALAGDLLTRAVRWSRDRRRFTDAIAHAQLCDDPDLRASTLFECGVGLILRGRHTEVIDHLDQNPVAPTVDDPIPALLRACAAVDIGDEVYAALYLDYVDQNRERGPANMAGSRELLYRVLRVDVAIAGQQRDVSDLVAAVEEALATGTGEVAAYAHTVLGAAFIHLGDPDRGEAAFARAIAIATAAGVDRLVVRAMAHHAAAAGYRGRPAIMETRARYGLNFANTAGVQGESYVPRLRMIVAVSQFSQGKPIDPPVAEMPLHRGVGADTVSAVGAHVPVHTYIVRFDQSSERMELTHRAWTTAMASLRASVSPFPTLMMLPRVAYMCLMVNRVDWAGQLARAGESAFGYSSEIRVVDAAVHLLSNKPDAGRKLLAPLLAEPHAHPQSHVTAWVLQACASDQLGYQHDVHRAIVRALELAHDTGVMRPLLEGGAAVASILSLYAGTFGRLDAYAETVRSAITIAPPSGFPTLTRAESQVLMFMPSSRTSSEIAEVLCLSVNTVKTHLRGIYRKLGVQHRRDAVSVAHKLGLL